MNEKSNTAPKGETLLYTEKVLGQYKLFYVDYKENKRGRFLKITEKDGRFRSTIIIPEEALEDFGTVVNKVIQEHQVFCASSPAEESPAETPGQDAGKPGGDEPVLSDETQSVPAASPEHIEENIIDGPDPLL
jgi:hypothetical protein